MSAQASYSIAADYGYVEAGFDVGVTGAMSVIVEGNTATISSGRYCHSDLAAVLGSGEYTDFATALQSAILSASGAGYTVTYSRNSGSPIYTISHASTPFATAFTGDAGTRMANALGMESGAGQMSYSSVARPYYVMIPANGCRSEATDDYEPDGLVVGDYTLGGGFYSVSFDDPITFNDFAFSHEAKSATFIRAAGAGVPWTWQHLWRHCRGDQPFLVDIGDDDDVMYLRPEGGSFAPERVAADYDDYWTVRLKTYLAGRL